MTDIFEILDGTTDPNFYLRVDEQSTYTDVFCDGYTLRIGGGTGYSDCSIYDSGEVYRIRPAVYIGSVAYRTVYDADVTLEILENTPTRVVIRRTSDFEDSSNNPLSGSTKTVQYFYIYPDRFIHRFEWVTSSSINLPDTYINVMSAFQEGSGTYTTSIRENSETESEGPVLGAYNSADYIGAYDNDFVIIGIALENTDNDDRIGHIGALRQLQIGTVGQEKQGNSLSLFPLLYHSRS